MICTIPNAQSLSNSIRLKNRTLVGIMMPSVWTAAPITFITSLDGLHYNSVFDAEGNELQLTVAANQHIVLAGLTSDFDHPTQAPIITGIKYLRLRSGTLATPVAQSQDSPIALLFKE